MKKVIALAAVVMAVAWCGAGSAAVNSVISESVALAAGTYPLVFEPRSASTGYSVVVESVTIPAGGSGTVGIYISNDEPIRSFDIPLIIRSIDAGSFMTHMAASYDESSRLNSYMNGEYENTVYVAPIINTYSTYTESVRRFHGAPVAPDYVSPDGIYFVRHRIMPGNNLPAGSDGAPGAGTPMITIDFQVNMEPGRFEIDTCHVAPANHLMFIHGADVSEPKWLQAILPEFTKGIVTIKRAQGPFDPRDTVSVEEPPENLADDSLIVHVPGDTVVADDTAVVIVNPPADTAVVADTTIIGVPVDTVAVTDTLVTDPPFDSSLAGDTDDGQLHDMLSGERQIQRITNYPNPFNSATTIRYRLDGARKVSVVVFDLLGRHVSTLVDAYQPPGEYLIPWAGRDASGTPVPTGIYFYRVQMDHARSVGKMVLLK